MGIGSVECGEKDVTSMLLCTSGVVRGWMCIKGVFAESFIEVVAAADVKALVAGASDK